MKLVDSALGGFFGARHICPKAVSERSFHGAVVFVGVVVDIQFPADAAVVGAGAADTVEAVIKVRDAKKHVRSSCGCVFLSNMIHCA